MAPGHIHNIATVIVSGALAAGAYYLGSSELYAVSAGVATGLFLSPDLDVRHGSVSDTNVRQIARPLAWPWRIMWWIYARLIPCHRHWLSHAPFIGTLGRLLYLSPWFLVLYLVFNFPPEWSRPYLIFAVAGLCLSDILHWLMDGMPLYS